MSGLRRLALALPLAMAAASADSQIVEQHALLEEAGWLGGAGQAAALTAGPPVAYRDEAAGGRLSPRARLGELAFRAPRILGGAARRGGLACQTCHTSGHLNRAFFVPDLSDRPGNVDVRHVAFDPASEDDRFAPVNIPSLRGVRFTAPYGRDGRVASLREFTRQVIVTEFAGDEPEGWLLDALVTYQEQLDFATEPGQLQAAASRGAALFRQPPPSGEAPPCSGCHTPSAGFVDRLSHDVGSGGDFDTPTLRDVALSAPYFHDGRYGTLAEVVRHFDRLYGLGLQDGQIEDLVAYLEAIGGAGQAGDEPVELERDLADLDAYLAVLKLQLENENAAISGFIARATRHWLRGIWQRFAPLGPDGPGARLVEWSQRLQDIDGTIADGRFLAAQDMLAGLTARIQADLPALHGAAGRSLYDPARLSKALAAGG